MNETRRVCCVGPSDQRLCIRYLGPVGLGGGRYLVTTSGKGFQRLSSFTWNLVMLRNLRDHLTEEIERAATPGG